MPVISKISGTIARVTFPPHDITVSDIATVSIPSLTSSGTQASPTLILYSAVPNNATSPAENGESGSSPNLIPVYIVLVAIPAIFVVIAVIATIRERRVRKAYNPDIEMAQFRPHWFPWLNAVYETEGKSPGKPAPQARVKTPVSKRPSAETGRWKWKVKDKGKQPERPIRPPRPTRISQLPNSPSEYRHTNSVTINDAVNSDSIYRGSARTAEEWQEFLRRGNPWARTPDNTRSRAHTQPSTSKGRRTTTQQETGESSRSRTRSEPLPFPLPPNKFRNRAPSEPNAYAHLQIAHSQEVPRRPRRHSKASSLPPTLYDRSSKPAAATESPSRAQSHPLPRTEGKKSTRNGKVRRRTEVPPVPPNTPSTTPRALSPNPGAEQSRREQQAQDITIPYEPIFIVGPDSEDDNETGEAVKKTRDIQAKGKEVVTPI